MVKTVCDRCGKDVNTVKTVKKGSFTPDTQELNKRYDTRYKYHLMFVSSEYEKPHRVDLCDKCMDLLQEFMLYVRCEVKQ